MANRINAFDATDAEAYTGFQISLNVMDTLASGSEVSVNDHRSYAEETCPNGRWEYIRECALALLPLDVANKNS